MVTDRELIEAWLAFVVATHRDFYTILTLETWLEGGTWPPKAVDTARRIVDAPNERC